MGSVWKLTVYEGGVVVPGAMWDTTAIHAVYLVSVTWTVLKVRSVRSAVVNVHVNQTTTASTVTNARTDTTTSPTAHVSNIITTTTTTTTVIKTQTGFSFQSHLFQSAAFHKCKSYLLCLEFADKILIFAVLERRLLQWRETEASFCFYNFCSFITWNM